MESAHLWQRHFDGEGDDQCAAFHADGRVHAVAELVADPLHHRIGQRAVFKLIFQPRFVHAKRNIGVGER